MIQAFFIHALFSLMFSFNTCMFKVIVNFDNTCCDMVQIPVMTTWNYQYINPYKCIPMCIPIPVYNINARVWMAVPAFLLYPVSVYFLFFFFTFSNFVLWYYLVCLKNMGALIIHIWKVTTCSTFFFSFKSLPIRPSCILIIAIIMNILKFLVPIIYFHTP